MLINHRLDKNVSQSVRRRWLPSHAVLRSFEAAARLESFTAAARELHLTQSAVSRQVRELEEGIGTDLFRRVGRRVAPTEAGRSLALDLATDLERIRQTLFRAAASGNHGTVLRIAVLPTFASRWLIPRLPDFTRRHPSVGLSLATRLEPFDLVGERFDIAIHFGTADWPDTKMVHLCDEEMIAVSSPQFRANHQIKEPASLINVPLLHLETRPAAWMDWFHASGLPGTKLLPGQMFDQFSMIISAALSSLGAALLPAYLIEKELRDGSLLRLDGVALNTQNSYYVVTPSGTSSPPVTAFSNWIKSADGASSLSGD